MRILVVYYILEQQKCCYCKKYKKYEEFGINSRSDYYKTCIECRDKLKKYKIKQKLARPSGFVLKFD